MAEELGGQRRAAVWNFTPVEGVKRIVAVGAGKGGVGKSTVTVGLAHALAGLGLRVAVLDADIYGPSLPRMLGLKGPGSRNWRIIRWCLRWATAFPMSMHFITGDNAAVLRGPMISKALHQLLRATNWKDIDILLVDLPPGTGDVQLSLAQAAPLDGAVIVTTPQAVAVDDARKALSMFRKVNVKVLGVVENMAGGMFGAGGGEALAREADVPLLGSIPLDAALCAAMDAGEIPPVLVEWESIARLVVAGVKLRA